MLPAVIRNLWHICDRPEPGNALVPYKRYVLCKP